MSDHEELLPEPLPDDPLPLAAAWYRHALETRVQPNPDAMVLATVDGAGRPSARVVLCKQFAPDAGYLVFFTNYGSRKAAELDGQRHAAAVFHWDALRRQVRIEGSVERSPAAESDSYFASRSWRSRIGAWASRQSRPVGTRAALLARVGTTAERFGVSLTDGRLTARDDAEPGVPRPDYWGGYRLMIERIELWAEGADRIHDRGCWTRATPAGQWRNTRLEP